MIVTVTVNPAMGGEKTAEIDCLRPHALNRLAGVVSDVGGKGINALQDHRQALGRQSVACGFLAGHSVPGADIEQTLRQWPGGGHPARIFSRCPGRLAPTSSWWNRAGELTELNEQGPRLSPADLDALTGKLEGSPPRHPVCTGGQRGARRAAGTLPRPDPEAETGGAKVFVDADGPLLARALEAVPDIIKPNAFELGQYFGLASHPGGGGTDRLGPERWQRGASVSVCISRWAGRAPALRRERGAGRAPGPSGDAPLHRGGRGCDGGGDRLRRGGRSASRGLPASGHGGVSGGGHHPGHPPARPRDGPAADGAGVPDGIAALTFRTILLCKTSRRKIAGGVFGMQMI